MLSEATAAAASSSSALALALRRACAHLRRNSSKEKKQICGGGETMARTPCFLPPSLPFSLLIHTRALETKGITGERTRIGKEKEGRGDFGASPLMVLTSAGSE